MKKMNRMTAVLAAILTMMMTGCGMNQNVGTTAEKSVVTSSDSVNTEESAKNTEAASANQKVNNTVEVIDLSQKADSAEQDSELFTTRDLAQTVDLSQAQYITVTNGQTIDITEEGVYVISGSAKNCTIRISADDAAKVQLVLDGVSITNDDSPAIYVISADKVFVTTTDSENDLTVSGQVRTDGDTNTDAVIFSKEDLVLNGTGTLNITSNYGNGITCKDDLKITGGTYNVTAALDCFEANDSISVYDGTFNIRTDKDGFHCENDEAEGTITILGGTYTIIGGSDGMQACALLQIDGGTMNITATEGLEDVSYYLGSDAPLLVLDAAEWIQTACDSKKYAENEASFTAGADITAYVALDTRITDVPAWLSDWAKTDDALTDDGNPVVTYQLYQKDFSSGETVKLGAVNQSNCVNYTVAVTAKRKHVIGDINADGVCDRADVVMLQEHLLTIRTLSVNQASVADMNADGKLNAVDLTLLKRLLL